MKRRLNFLAITLFFAVAGFSQDASNEITQTIRGRVMDVESEYPLIGVVVTITSLEKEKTSITDMEGYFEITGVSLGRHRIEINYMGYDPVILNNVLVQSGKEVNLSIKMEEQVYEAEESVIILERSKEQTANENVSVSGRTFSIEETSRFAGSRNDPARAAMNYAGVAVGNDSRNDIIIRGNSPLGVQWRLDDMVIPNPNHFGALGTTGGPVSILNNNVLDDSDFMTGAFPSEFGNALAGVFDLKMRNGNNRSREYLGQIGFNGLELGAEGPFSKNGNSSYLVNYRYSTLEFFDLLGISFGTVAIPQYQDISFKLNFSLSTKSELSVFGIGGKSFIEFKGSEIEDDDLFSQENQDVVFGSDMGVVGITHRIFLNEKTFSQVSLSASGIKNETEVDDLVFNMQQELIGTTPVYRNDFSQTKYSFNYKFKKKINSKNSITTGLNLDLYDFNMIDSVEDGTVFEILRQFDGSSVLSKGYFHWQHKFNNDLILNSGLYGQHFGLNNSISFEPRVGLRYAVNERQTVSLGSGMHSQLQPFQTYFQESLVNTQLVKSNKDLDFTRALHLVAGYDHKLNEKVRLKAEVYYQYVYDAPVEQVSSSFSMLNAGADFGVPSVDSLINAGTGRNIGLELTLERFYNNNFYYLVTASLFDSKYKGSDEVRRSTAFNGNYVFNLLFGKEWRLGENAVLALDLKTTLAGGKRITPIDVAGSIAEGETQFEDEQAFSDQFAPYFRPDVKITFRKEGKKVSQEWAFDVQNVINRQNPFNRDFNQNTQQVTTNNQLGIFPIMQYRILF